MEIPFSVGNQVMMPVMGRPPKGAFLIRGCARERNQELRKPAGAIGAMSQQPVKAGGNGEHPQDVKRKAGNDSDAAHSGPNNQQTSKMHEEKLRADEVVEFVLIRRAIFAD